MNPGGSSGGKGIGCIGKCTSGLTLEELDLITDHIERTLGNSQGRKIFRKYLAQGQRKTDLACLELYIQCSECIDRERVHSTNEKEPPSLEPLMDDFNSILNTAEEFDDVSEIDLALLERYTEALDSSSRNCMLDVLEETKIRLMNHLRRAHMGFRDYATKPCPRS